jgi:hypothetical protein
VGPSAGSASIVVALLVLSLAVLIATPTSRPEIAGSTSSPRSSDLPGEPAPSTPSRAANPFTQGMAASRVIGQTNFTSAGAGHGPSNLTIGDGAAVFDANGDLWVVDGQNNRVLEFLPPFSNGESASIALGQSSLSTNYPNTTAGGLWEPGGIAVDAHGDLFVADSTNNRILEYVPPFHTGMNASLVLGQGSFTTRYSGVGATNLTHPQGLALGPGGALFAADTVNNRVVEYAPPFATGMAASLVLGQATFGASAAATSARNLSGPADVAIDRSGDVWVADSGNRRVVEFPAPLSSGELASAVLGQYNFTLTNESLPDGMSTPQGLSFDAGGDLWVADSGLPQNRVTEYLPPLASHEPPGLAIGQQSLNGSRLGCNATTFYRPTMPLFDPAGDLWVIDGGNARALEFEPANYTVTFSEVGLPGGTNWSVTLETTVRSSTTPSIAFSVWNGTYSYSVGSVAGYSASPTGGPVLVSGAAQAFTIHFNTSSGGGGSSGSGGSAWWWIVLVVVVIAAALLAVALLRRRRRPPSTTPDGAPPVAR